MGNKGITRREILVTSLSAAVVAATTALAGLYSRTVLRLNGRIRELEGTDILPLARACHYRWSRYNGRYSPSLNEVLEWIRAIVEFDEVLKDPLFYCVLIDVESLGNPTLYQPHDGKTSSRGLGSISYDAATDIVKAYKLEEKVKAIGTALFIPRFNIFAMIKCIERLYSEDEGMIYTLFAYNAGRGTTRSYMKRGEKIPTKYYKRHGYRRRLIEDLIKKGEGQ